MSMRDIPASGYVINGRLLVPTLPQEYQVAATQALDDQDCEAFNEILNFHLPEVFPDYQQAFLFGDEDTSEELERGEVYVIFDESDLFVKTPKPELLAFRKAVGKDPEYQRWSVWG